MKKQKGLLINKKNSSLKPIGIFDSGLGGLSVAKEVFRFMPRENVIYFGDTARVPYGNKSKKTITIFSIENANFLKKRGVKLIIVACNTSCSLSLPTLEKRLNIPVIGVIDPAVKKAVEVSKNKRIGVIGTNSTINSKVYDSKLKELDRKIKVFSKSCPLFVPLAEEGWLDTDITYRVAKIYLDYLKLKNIDTLILACTHYPLLEKIIKKVLGKKVALIDSAHEVAQVVKAALKQIGALSEEKKKPDYQFYVSDESAYFIKVGEKFLGRKINCVRKV